MLLGAHSSEDVDRQHELRRLYDAVDDLIRVLANARGQVGGLRDETGATASRIAEVLGGTATGADQEAIDGLDAAGAAATRSLDAIDESIHLLQRAASSL